MNDEIEELIECATLWATGHPFSPRVLALVRAAPALLVTLEEAFSEITLNGDPDQDAWLDETRALIQRARGVVQRPRGDE